MTVTQIILSSFLITVDVASATPIFNIATVDADVLGREPQKYISWRREEADACVEKMNVKSGPWLFPLHKIWLIILPAPFIN